LVDIVRLDHFRGFESFWEVPAAESTAINGRWVKGPGAALFKAIRQALGTLPIIAEDLGVITPAVEKLRDRFGFPGMRVLQFAFSSDASCVHLPHQHVHNCVVYTGTHDNDTTLGWYLQSSQPHERDYARRYMGVDGHDIAWDMIHLAMQSVAQFVIYPAQDLLSLGTKARMNFPSRLGDNWAWRCKHASLTIKIQERLRQMALDFGRCEADGTTDEREPGLRLTRDN
jgi:4-alpha-glucanotransferase